MIVRFICIGLVYNYLENPFNNKNYQDNSHKRVKCAMCFLQITYLFTLGKHY